MRAPSGRLLALLLCVASAGCGLGDLSIDEADPGSVPAQPTYERDVRALMGYYCSPCHSPDAQLGTAGGYDYSSYGGVVAGYAGIVDQVFNKQSMPPGAARRLTLREEAIIERWAAQGFEVKASE